MRRLTKTYEDGTYAAADDLPCGENSWEYKKLLLDKLGAYVLSGKLNDVPSGRLFRADLGSLQIG